MRTWKYVGKTHGVYCANARIIFALAGLSLITGDASAETRAQCEAHIRPNTTMAVEAAKGGIVGTGGGFVVGAIACNTFLATAFLDMGLSYAVCMSTVAGFGALLGGAAGTGIGEDKALEKKQQCARLGEY